MSNYDADSGRIWSQSEQGHQMHAYLGSDGSALCRKSVYARLWMPDREPVFHTISEAYKPLCPKCSDQASHLSAPRTQGAPMFDTFTVNEQFIIRRAAELTEQMDAFNQPGGYPTDAQLQEWAGAASGILKMVTEKGRADARAICRTCGFADCPGARGGDCPRWPARDGQAGARALRDLRNSRGIDA